MIHFSNWPPIPTTQPPGKCLKAWPSTKTDRQTDRQKIKLTESNNSICIKDGIIYKFYIIKYILEWLQVVKHQERKLK